MRYAPFASVDTERTFSMSTGLLASTVTPGSTAPVASFTTPANALCARAVDGSARKASTAVAIAKRVLVMRILLDRESTNRQRGYLTDTTESKMERHGKARGRDRFRKVGSTWVC